MTPAMTQRLTKTRAALRRHLVLTVTTAVVLVTVVAAGAGELTARNMIENRIAKAAPALGGTLAVGVAGDWALWDLAQASIPGSTSAATTHASVRSPTSASVHDSTTSASATGPPSPAPTPR
ncbi:hypothetical protein WKI68_37985 [Streptomyces sp. MS1.HAVA.3]|uniref:ABC transporter permease n=1 Tax=Streptomyces caledonius TaxID=3134107 RepID=A0ABU8UC33_9ACTN